MKVLLNSFHCFNWLAVLYLISISFLFQTVNCSLFTWVQLNKGCCCCCLNGNTRGLHRPSFKDWTSSSWNPPTPPYIKMPASLTLVAIIVKFVNKVSGFQAYSSHAGFSWPVTTVCLTSGCSGPALSIILQPKITKFKRIKICNEYKHFHP